MYGDFRSTKSAMAASTRSSSSSLSSRLSGRGLAHHRVPGRHLIQLPEDRLGLGREQLHQSRVELAAAAGAGHFDGSLDPTGVMEHLNDIGEVDQAS